MRASLVLVLSLLALLLSGCGNVESGAVDGKPAPTPGAGDDDDDDDDDGGSYDPGPVPTELGGVVGVGRFRDNYSNDFTGLAMFFPVPAPVPPTLAEVWNDYPDMPMDTCKEVYPSSVGVSSNITPPMPGDLTFEGPAGDLTFTEMSGSGMYMTIWNDTSKFVPLEHYNLHATGGQIQAFDQPFLAPGEVTALSPDPLANPNTPFVIQRSQPLSLTWESVEDGMPIYLYFTQQDSTESQPFHWMCKLTDDGAFTVPASVFANFGTTMEPWVGEQWRDKMELRRARYGSFYPQGAVGPILTSFESGWYAHVRFQ